MRAILRGSILLGIVLFARAGSLAAELTIAAASDLKFALDAVIVEFRNEEFRRNGHVTKFEIAYGSSGNFYAQLRNKAPFDLYLSADIEYARKLAEAGLTLDANVFHYADGRLALWTSVRSGIDLEKLGMQSLLDPSVRKVAIANPQHAPYGRAAVAALKSFKLFDQVESRLVYGENVAQAAQFAQTGAADIGIVALSLTGDPSLRAGVRIWEIPSDVHPRIEQGGVISKWAKDPDAARRFRGFLLSEPGREVLKRYKFSLPEK